jgi:hypothetical protein
VRSVAASLARSEGACQRPVNGQRRVALEERCLRHRVGVGHVTPSWVLQSNLRLL